MEGILKILHKPMTRFYDRPSPRLGGTDLWKGGPPEEPC